MNQSELLACLKLDSFIALDFETTGLQVETDRPIEVAAILFKNGKPSERYDVSFLQAMAQRHKKEFFEREFYDTLTLSRAFLFFSTYA